MNMPSTNENIDYGEVFPTPLLSEVVCEVKFPILLMIPLKIAEFQQNIIEEFPETKELIDQSILIKPGQISSSVGNKSWDFINSEGNTICRVLKDRFSLISHSYKSWKDKENQKGFKNLLMDLSEKFLTLYPIKKFSRLGLRYINKIPLEENTTSWFKKFFVPLFNIDKYTIENLTDNVVRLVVNKNDSIKVTILALSMSENDKNYYILDFDAFSTNILAEDYENTIENLHDVILHEFHSLITENCREKMRGKL